MRRQAPDGARDGGDLAREAFVASLESFVREVLQNVKDACGGNRSAQVRFRLIELEGKALEAFKTAMRWSELQPHLDAAAKKDRKLRETLDAAEQRLRILVVEDCETTGLRGPEDGADAASGPNEFALLTKDRLFSDKSSGQSGAGGSYGLGKAVLWAFSTLRTVIFSSWLDTLLDGQVNPRLFGRTHLPWHEALEQKWDGPGWFGNEAQPGRPVSVFGDVAASTAEPLCLGRRPGAAGTSILVVGFHEPQEETERPLDEIAASILHAAEKWFWPSLVQTGSRGLAVSVQVVRNGSLTLEKSLGSEDVSDYGHFVRLHEAYRSGNAKQTFESAGDVVCRSVTVKVPAHKHGNHPAFSARADLVVALADNGQPARNTIALFRKPGMVVDYWTGPDQRLGLGKRPFYALLVCGEAVVDPVQPAAGRFEDFLRCAENPKHDAWDRWDRLREFYHTPYRAPLDKSLLEDVSQVLAELVVAGRPPGSDAPKQLMEKFRFGIQPGAPESGVTFGDAQAVLGPDGAWQVVATIAYHGESPERGWKANVDLRFSEDGRSSGDGRLIGTAEIGKAGLAARVRVDNGIAVLEVPKGASEIRVPICLRSDPARHPVRSLASLAAVELRVTGG